MHKWPAKLGLDLFLLGCKSGGTCRSQSRLSRSTQRRVRLSAGGCCRSVERGSLGSARLWLHSPCGEELFEGTPEEKLANCSLPELGPIAAVEAAEP